MYISETEFIGLVIIFMCLTSLIKSIDFVFRRTRLRYLSYREYREIVARLVILEGWMGMDKNEDEFDKYIEKQKAYEKNHGKHSLHNKPRR